MAIRQRATISPRGTLPPSVIWAADFTTDFGTITALTGIKVTQAVIGLKTADAVSVSCVGVIPSGAVIANCRVSAVDTLEIHFTTAVVAGVAIGSLAYRVMVVGN